METAAETFAPSDRDRFLEALIALCVERGPDGVTMEALTDRSGLSEARFAELFGESAGVEECMLAAETAIIGELIGTISATYAAERTEWDRGISRVLAVLELMAANPSKAHFAYITARSADSRVREAQLSGRQALASVIDRLREAAPECAVPVRAALGAIGGVEAVIRREILAGRSEDLPRLLPTVVYSTAVPFLGQETAIKLSNRARELLRRTAWS